MDTFFLEVSLEALFHTEKKTRFCTQQCTFCSDSYIIPRRFFVLCCAGFYFLFIYLSCCQSHFNREPFITLWANLKPNRPTFSHLARIVSLWCFLSHISQTGGGRVPALGWSLQDAAVMGTVIGLSYKLKKKTKNTITVHKTTPSPHVTASLPLLW